MPKFGGPVGCTISVITSPKTAINELATGPAIIPPIAIGRNEKETLKGPVVNSNIPRTTRSASKTPHNERMWVDLSSLAENLKRLRKLLFFKRTSP